MDKLKNNGELKMNIKMKLNDNLKAVKPMQTESKSSENLWQPIKDVIVKLESEELGYIKKKMKQKWMTQEILQLMELRRQYKNEDLQKYKETQCIIRRKIKFYKYV